MKIDIIVKFAYLESSSFVEFVPYFRFCLRENVFYVKTAFTLAFFIRVITNETVAQQDYICTRTSDLVHARARFDRFRKDRSPLDCT